MRTRESGLRHDKYVFEVLAGAAVRVRTQLYTKSKSGTRFDLGINRLAPCAPVALGEPRREASAGRREPGGELRVERGDLLAELEEVEVEEPLALADVGTGPGTL
jgi:hypothetical protein